MSALVVARASIRRVVRDRIALFFLIALPIFVIILIGATVRGFSTFRVGVVDLDGGPVASELVTAMRHSGDLAPRLYRSVASATTGVSRGEVSVAVVIPAGMERSLRSGHVVDVEVLSEQSSGAQQAAASAVSSQVAAQGSRIQAALFASAHSGGSFDQNLARATSLQVHLPAVEVTTRQVDSRPDTLPEGFSYSAPTMLVLFMFINTLAGATNIVETRRLGMYERMGTTPTRPWSIIAGESLSLLAVSAVQAGLIVLIGAIAFGVAWGDPVAALVLVALWALLSAGAGMLAGTLFRTPEQASVLAPTLGIALGMLGGCMWPLSIVSRLMRAIGHATPHAWAVDAWTSLIARGGSLATIGPELGTLAGFTAVLMTLATVRLHRVLS